MLQDIEPYQFNNEFKEKEPEIFDSVLIFKEGELLFDNNNEQIKFPTIEQVNKIYPDINESLIYLFSVDNQAFYYSMKTINETSALCYKNIHEHRETLPIWIVFIAATAYHLAQWYESNRYCGKCAKPMIQSKKERALCCESCGTIKYPTISPAIIVGITDGDKILMSRYANGPYKKFALIAGFTEIGEDLEGTVKREVMEEVGIRVKNIRYFKSQPWPFSQSVLVGFFAELDGKPDVNIDFKELSEAVWLTRDEIPESNSTISLTNEMIEAFRENKHSLV